VAETTEDRAESDPGGLEVTARRGGPRNRRIALIGLAGALLLVIGLVLPRLLVPRLTEEQVRALVTTTLQREVREAFLVTGTLDVTATTRVRNTRRFLPGILDVPLGTAESTVRVPGRVSYGLPVSDVGAEAIRLVGDTVLIQVPAPRVFAIDPNLEQMEVETEVGWLRLSGDAREEVQQRAIALVRSSMQAQAERHLADSEQPRINSAETLHELLRPAFVAAGIESPVFRFQLSENLSYTADRARP
jgi:hypothetical protein